MRLRLLGTILLPVIGIVAVVIVLFAPGTSSTSGTHYTTAAATVTDVVKQVVATGTVEPVTVYDLAFGSAPAVASSSASSSTSGSSSGSGSGSGNGTVTWKVTTVSAAPGQAVRQGDVLAVADDSDAQLALTVAKANLASVDAKLAADEAGLSPNDKAAAKLSVTQAQQAVSQAKTAQGQTIAQDNLKISQQAQAVTGARAKLAADDADPTVPSTQLDQDRSAVTQAQNALASLKLQVSQANTQAANQVRSAQLQLQSSQYAYRTKTQGATDAQLAADNAAVATAQQSVASAQATVDGARLVSPVDGVVLAVNITPDLDAPTGIAVSIQSNAFQVSASVAEADYPSLKLGQAADVTITATGLTASGTVTEISPSGTAGSGGGVVSYAIVTSLPTPPAGTASGMSAQVSITTALATGVVAVPSIALVGNTGGYSVRVLDSSGQPQLVAVQVGLVTSSLAEIQGGITQGTEVVVGTSSSRQGTTSASGGFGGGGFGGGLGGGGGVRVVQP